MKILVAIDFSEMSPLALAWALAHRPDDPHELHLVHVVEDTWLDLFATKASHDLAEEMELLAREAETELGRLPETTHAHVAVHRHVLRGRPQLKVPELAKEIGADLLVLGSVGRRGLERALLGSVAERIVRTAPCTVVCVKA